MRSTAGVVSLVRLIGRRDRIRIGVWVIGLAALVTVLASSIRDLYPTEGALIEGAAAIRASATQIALNGPAQGLESVGGRVAFEVGNVGLIGVALMSIFMMGRHTRGEEEAGRTEVVRAGAVGRQAPLAAAVAVVVGMDVAVGIAVAVGLIAQGLGVGGSLTLGASFAMVGIVFAAFAAAIAQATENTRVVYGAASVSLAAAFALRAVGDVGDGRLSWLSPLGWVQASRPFAGERGWPLLVALAFATVALGVAGWLGSRRDLGAGLIADRSGPAAGGGILTRPLGLAVRLQRPSLLGWSAGLLCAGLALGSFAREAETFVGENDQVHDVITTTPRASAADSFLATFLALLALVATGFAIQAAQRLRGEEVNGTADAVLASAVTRTRWVASHLTVAAVGVVLVLSAAGVGVGLAYGISTGDASQVPRLVAAALFYVPAVWVLVGITAALFGLAPRATPAAWGALAACMAIALLSQLLDLPWTATAISPFQHVARTPAVDAGFGSPVVLAAMAAALAAVGLAGFRRRDLT